MMMFLARWYCLLALALILNPTSLTLVVAQDLQASEIYVDGAQGNDEHLGTLAQPVKSLAKAQQLARKFSAQGGNVTVLIRGGTYAKVNDRPQGSLKDAQGGRYHVEQPWLFDVRDSAAEGRTVTYAAYNREPVFISGGKPITGWKLQNELWVTELKEVREGRWNFRELFVNGERRPRARHPTAVF